MGFIFYSRLLNHLLVKMNTKFNELFNYKYKRLKNKFKRINTIAIIQKKQYESNIMLKIA